MVNPLVWDCGSHAGDDTSTYSFTFLPGHGKFIRQSLGDSIQIEDCTKGFSGSRHQSACWANVLG